MEEPKDPADSLGNPGDVLLNTDQEPRVVLAAVDTTAAAPRVISFAARFVRAFPEATLHVVHVLRHSRVDRARAGVPDTTSDAIADAKEHLEYHRRLAQRQCKNTVVAHFTAGNPTNEILRFCSELDSDLLVIATDDHAGFERLLLGSIAETLVRRAPCAVTVIRQKLAAKR